uniref:regulator of G-protein signaling egl-10-like isoform X1 n=2 Tax=Ciona intestinalis TaxID=7719 RepID=UPI00089DC423|nr:regulator of G-protein signaling egl-10-like isoform X1 [Ciona intestinalis]|eukprot:XP_018668887.1 regulator of G-protein signaling egl-10-like isoform X1 [Ciona intestinalis]
MSVLSSSYNWRIKAWLRAYEGVLIAQDSDNDKERKEEIVLKAEDLNDNAKNQLKKERSFLIFPPRQLVLGQVSALIMAMQNEIFHIKPRKPKKTTINSRQSFRIKSSNECENFTADMLIQWLEENLDISSFEEASHLATLLCRMGFVYPCKYDWNVTITLPTEDPNLQFRFQNPYYWPTETLSASDTDYASHLLSRESGCHDAPLDEYEMKYLQELRRLMLGNWNVIQSKVQIADKLLSQCNPGDREIKRRQEYAFWRVNRPLTNHNSDSRVRPKDWNVMARGLNRYFSSYVQVAVTDETKSANPRSITASCTRIIKTCTEWMNFDPLWQEEEEYKNPWHSDAAKRMWPEPSNIAGEPYKQEVVSWGLSFEKLIESKIGRVYFQEHLKKEFSEENLLFYLRCAYLHSAPLSEVDGLIKEIFEQYISPNSDTPINIDTQTALKVSKLIKTKRTRHTFDPALDHIYSLMKKDSYKRFLVSSVYKAAVKNAKHPVSIKKEKPGFARIIVRMWRTSQFNAEKQN